MIESKNLATLKRKIHFATEGGSSPQMFGQPWSRANEVT
jgi:hypothetical protein